MIKDIPEVLLTSFFTGCGVIDALSSVELIRVMALTDVFV